MWLHRVKPLDELLLPLTHEQQLHVALLADRWGLPVLSSAVVDALEWEGPDVSEAATEQLLSLQAVPDIILTLLESVVLRLLGDLEAVWADPVARARLLSIAPRAMKALLSSDELKVRCVCKKSSHITCNKVFSTHMQSFIRVAPVAEA